MDQSNPLLNTTGLPRFDLIEAEHVVPAVRQVLADAEKTLEEIETTLTPTWDGLIKPLEAMDIPFEYAWAPIGHLMGVKNSDELRQAYEEAQGEVVVFGLRLKQSRPIYDGLVALKRNDEWKNLTEVQQRIIDLKLRDAKHAGVGLDGEARERFNEIAQELSQIGTEFSNHVLDATKAFELVVTDKDHTEGWPTTLKQGSAQSWNQANESSDATPEDGPWRITLDFPSFHPFMLHSRQRDQREQVYRAFTSRAASGEFDNTELIARTLKLRREMAKLLGYDNYAQVSLATKMASNVTAVDKMSDELFTASRPHGLKDLDDLKQLADEPLAHWDIGFWAERLREQRFDYTEEQLRPYFPMPRVLDGLFGLCERLFGISVEPADGEAPVWHSDVTYFHINDSNGEAIASFYLDPYSRPADKRGGAWFNECQGRRRINGEIRLPVAYLICNGTPPVGDTPSLMSFDEVLTLFHEFGHGLQHMLTQIDEADAAGISGVEWDAVEIASQFMENWCYHKPTLTGMTSHVETGEPLPDDLFEKILAARTYRSGSGMLRQLEFGITDMQLHDQHDPDGDETAFDVHRRVAEKTAVLPPLPENRSLCSFGHIFAGGYAAGYYSYKWSEVLSADAFAAFEEVGLDNEEKVAELGQRYRNTILGLGGGRAPMDVFRDFRGREPSTEALLRHHGLLESPN